MGDQVRGDEPSRSKSHEKPKLIVREMPASWVIQVANGFEVEAHVTLSEANKLTGNHWTRREKREALLGAAQYKLDIATALRLLVTVQQNFPPDDAREMMRKRGWLGPQLHDIAEALVSPARDGSTQKEAHPNV